MTTTLPRVRFAPSGAFHAELRRDVDAYFQRTGRSARADWRMRLKTAVMLAWGGASYGLLVLGDFSATGSALLAISLGLAMAGIGFDVMHDANHGSYSRLPGVNRALGFTLDLVGGSSYMWRQKHNVLHHTYTNISGLDVDLGGNALLRFAPAQPLRPVHRFQHLYVWLLYMVYPLGWWLVDDFQRLATGRVGGNHISRPRGAELFGLFAGKAAFLLWAVIVPVAVHRSWVVIPFALLTTATLGLTLAVVFQLAHCVGDAEFPDAGDGAMPTDWAVHQVSTTVDFARRNRLLGWYLGGLNFQVEHHLFPKVCHVHYRALSGIVEERCRAHGIRYRAHASFGAAVAANVRWLRRMGGEPVAGQGAKVAPVPTSLAG